MQFPASPKVDFGKQNSHTDGSWLEQFLHPVPIPGIITPLGRRELTLQAASIKQFLLI